jgi:hypothetical protein
MNPLHKQPEPSPKGEGSFFLGWQQDKKVPLMPTPKKPIRNKYFFSVPRQ